MNSNCDQRWPAREPPGDFATRTVDALLASAQLRRRAGRQPRSIVYLLLAALFASGSALAITWSHYHKRAVNPPAMASQPALTQLPPKIVVAPVAAATSAPALSASVQVTSPKKSSTRPAKAAASNQKPVQPPLRQPACGCERGFSDFICDCY